MAISISGSGLNLFVNRGTSNSVVGFYWESGGREPGTDYFRTQRETPQCKSALPSARNGLQDRAASFDRSFEKSFDFGSGTRLRFYVLPFA